MSKKQAQRLSIDPDVVFWQWNAMGNEMQTAFGNHEYVTTTIHYCLEPGN